MNFIPGTIALFSLVTVLISWFLMCGSPGRQNSEHVIRAGSVPVGNRYFTGVLHDNQSNKDRQGSGFNPLTHFLYPGRNLYRDDAVGLNFEHIMNGTAADAGISMFTPRKDLCFLNLKNDSTASVIHKAGHSSWQIESEMIYQFNGKYTIDLTFSVLLSKNKFPLDYVGFMWASYMNCALDRRIHFIGMNQGHEEWMVFGDDTPDGFETGTIGYYMADHLPYEEGAKTLNIIEHPCKKFVFPFYYGLVHGSGDPAASRDTMVYIMMFDQKESVRFAMWNFFRDSEGQPDTHSPAWDWQYLIRKPELNRNYRYRARLVYKPFAGRADVKQEYQKWLKEINNQ